MKKEYVLSLDCQYIGTYNTMAEAREAWERILRAGDATWRRGKSVTVGSRIIGRNVWLKARGRFQVEEGTHLGG